MNRVLFIAAAALAAGPALAQYKVVGPDGRITYTDRPPPAAAQGGQVSGVRGSAAANSATAALPYELQKPVSRFPVVLYTAPNCTLCDTARRMLRQRGIPLTERQVQQPEDLALVEQQTGGRGIPAMTVGAQAIHGYGETQWANLLDLAGYPRESKLPRDYVAAAPVPISPRAVVPAPAVPEPAPAPTPEPPSPPPGSPPPIRF